MGQPLGTVVWRFLKSTEHGVTFCPHSFSSKDYIPRCYHSCVRNCTIPRNHSAEANQCPLMDGWKGKVRSIRAVEYYSVSKRKEIVMLLCG